MNYKELTKILNDKLLNHQKSLNVDIYNDSEEIAYAIEENDTIIAGMTAKRTDQTLHIERLAVDEAYKYQGLGTKLIQKTINYAKNHQIHKITLTTLNFQAKDFYEKQGFIVFGQLEDVPKVGFTKYYMVLDLKKEVKE